MGQVYAAYQGFGTPSFKPAFGDCFAGLLTGRLMAAMSSLTRAAASLTERSFEKFQAQFFNLLYVSYFYF